MGPLPIPARTYYGVQTARSLLNFPFPSSGPAARMPRQIVDAQALVKKCAARYNVGAGKLAGEKGEAIMRAADEVIGGSDAVPDSQFPLAMYQTGSGTQTNMNVNEVLSSRATHLLSGSASAVGDRSSPHYVHPNDDVNMGQSSNDSFPTAMHIACVRALKEATLPGLRKLQEALKAKGEEYASVIKIGRTHCQDATPLTVGQEFGGYAQQLEYSVGRVEAALPCLSRLALGGTAVGTGLNTTEGYDAEIAALIAAETGHPFVAAENKFEALAAHDSLVEAHGALNAAACSLNKIATDLQLLGSGPRSGLGELSLPANEPGSSIMPGKVNPTQCESIAMVCARVMGNQTTITVGGCQGKFELNTFKPVMCAAFLESASLIGEAAANFAGKCVEGIVVNEGRVASLVAESLMLVTALNPVCGYDKAAQIAKKAHKDGTSLKRSCLELGFVSEKDFDEAVDVTKMVGPKKKAKK
ncbi:hypothetical protein TeGR_g4202 [Tetraparma gracilis]|uniref:fumarate hydratase n=1 Tax=Tetraparma gracilis TaxID=2962635 RepID=A0ABQ6NB42_9STRA|nr:hypothetical protein TeGR_g4202 [Tetraparma gracilis]